MGKRTDTRSRVAAYIAQYVDGHGGVGPTLAEIARAVGLKSTNTVSYHLDKLEAEGVVSVERLVESGQRRVGRMRVNREPNPDHPADGLSLPETGRGEEWDTNCLNCHHFWSEASQFYPVCKDCYHGDKWTPVVDGEESGRNGITPLQEVEG